MTDPEVQLIADSAADKAITRWCELIFGLDVTDPDERAEVRADFQWMRKRRKGEEKAHEWLKKSVVTTVAGGLCYALWSGVKVALGK